MQYELGKSCVLAALLVAATTWTGCAIFESVGSISDSVSSPFEWSSDSSGSGDSAMYREDVERLTVAHLRGGGDPESLRSSLAELARRQGLTDWRSDPSTRQGLVAGLRASGLDEAECAAYIEQLLGERAQHAHLSRSASEGTLR